MATANATKKSSYGLVIGAIIYGIITVIAIWIGITSKPDYAFKMALLCAVIASIVLVFILPKETRKKASYVWSHLITWGCIIFLPFGEYPRMSLFALILLGIVMTGYIAGMDAAAYKKKSEDDKISMSDFLMPIVGFIFAIIVLLYVGKATGYDKKVIGWFNSIVSEFDSSKKESDSQSQNDANTNPVNTGSPHMTANFKQWDSPFQFNINSAFTTKASGKIDLNSTGNNAANVVIYLKTSGNISLINGIVQKANSQGGQITGVWRQQKSGLGGYYVLDVTSEGWAHLILRFNNVDVAEIELKQM